MAVNPNPPAADPAAQHVATPQSDPTPAQVESRSVVSTLTNEIDDLWAKVEGRAEPEPSDVPQAAETPAETPAQATGRQRDANGRFQKAEAQTSETAPAADPVADAIASTPEAQADTPATPEPVLDREAIAREERARIEAEAAERERVRREVEAEQQHRASYEAYLGSDGDYDAVNAALRAAQRGDTSLLAGLDVTLPNGKRVSQVREDGEKGLNASEAASLMDAWDTNRKYEDVMGTRKIGQILRYWDAQTVQALASPDVDAAKVRSFQTPGEQMQAAIDTTRASVEQRLGEQHAAQIKAKDAEIEALNQRIQSLTTERTTLRSGQLAADAATPDRPGQPAAMRTGLPSIEELEQMSPDEFFRSGVNDRLLQMIPGGTQRRRTG